MWKKLIKIGLMLGCVLTALFLCGCSDREELFLLEDTEAAEETETEDFRMAEEDTAGSEDGAAVIYVHVCGAVMRPGVVEVPAGSRAQCAVEAAGGFVEEADTAYLNLAAVLSDGEQLYVPTKEEARDLRQAVADAEQGMIDLNTADAEALCTLPGIGESRAKDIIDYRQQSGGFSGIEDIMKVPGIKTSTYEKIKDMITVR